MNCQHSRRACELVSRDLSSNYGLGGETSEHCLEWVARRHSTANQKLMRVKERPRDHKWPPHFFALTQGLVELWLALLAKLTLRRSILRPRSILIYIAEWSGPEKIHHD